MGRIIYVLLQKNHSKNHRSPAHQDVQTENWLSYKYILFRVDSKAKDTDSSKWGANSPLNDDALVVSGHSQVILQPRNRLTYLQ
jgi:hypothetical protein